MAGGDAHGSRIEDFEMSTRFSNEDHHFENGSAFRNFKLASFGRHQELEKPRI